MRKVRAVWSLYLFPLLLIALLASSFLLTDVVRQTIVQEGYNALPLGTVSIVTKRRVADDWQLALINDGGHSSYGLYLAAPGERLAFRNGLLLKNGAPMSVPVNVTDDFSVEGSNDVGRYRLAYIRQDGPILRIFSVLPNQFIGPFDVTLRSPLERWTAGILLIGIVLAAAVIPGRISIGQNIKRRHYLVNWVLVALILGLMAVMAASMPADVALAALAGRIVALPVYLGVAATASKEVALVLAALSLIFTVRDAALLLGRVLRFGQTPHEA